MVLHRSTLDPYSPDRGLYECHGCGVRIRSDSSVASCAECGASVRNIAVPRE